MEEMQLCAPGRCLSRQKGEHFYKYMDFIKNKLFRGKLYLMEQELLTR